MNNDNIQNTMDNLSQLLGYSTTSKSKNDTQTLNEYQRAAEILREYALESGSEVLTPSQSIEDAIETFKNSYSPDVLDSLDDNSILQYMFYSSGDNTKALCCWIEMNKDCKSYFGSISGGSAFKFGLFQKRETGVWLTGSSLKQIELSEEEALTLGKDIRDALVKGARIIQNATLNTLEDYEQLDDKLNSEVGTQYCNLGWFHKYYSIICNDKLSGFHSTDWQMHVLRALKIRPSEKYYARSGQIAMIQKYAGWYYRQFKDVFSGRFGDPRTFVRLDPFDGIDDNSSEWAKRGVVGLGWTALGDLTDYVKGESIDRNEVVDKLKELYYPSDDRVASRRAVELSRFYRCDNNTVFVIMNDEKLIAVADNVGEYFYDKSNSLGHQRPATWRFLFEPDEILPQKTEGKMTSCYLIADADNLMFLYEKYYYGADKENTLLKATGKEIGSETQDRKLIYGTGYKSRFSRNRIVFGAPGTGKSYSLNLDRKELLGDENEEDYERVTFHPDYSYANFVGTYKPVPSKDMHGNDTITYSYVPGPFMRVYVKALRNSLSEVTRPFLLIIEEINRADVAAVFGDIFQLLDRGEDNVSEYPIQCSEDVRQYLSRELQISQDECTKMRIPDNMFIWATMNSADQGVFPMDTAFKRRWDFTYLGIDENDIDIRGKYVTLGSKSPHRVEWNELRKAINDFLANEKINEDKQLGPYFVARNIVIPTDGGDEIDSNLFCDVFKHKVLMYLFEDAAKQKRAKLFEGSSKGQSRYSKICEAFDEQGVGIFHSDIRSSVNIVSRETE